MKGSSPTISQGLGIQVGFGIGASAIRFMGI